MNKYGARFFGLTVIAAVLFLGAPAQAYFSDYLQADPLSKEMQLLKNPRSFDLKTASVIASGVSDNKLDEYVKKIDGYQSDLSNTYFSNVPKKGLIPWLRRLFGKDKPKQYNRYEKAQVIFDYMHKTVLKKYNEEYTTMDILLDEGKYNCLTSTLLYSILLNLNGVNNEIVALPTHVFSRVDTNGGWIDVENASPYGFAIGAKTDSQKNFNKLTGYEYSPDNISRKTLSLEEAVSILYANRAAMSAKEGKPADAFQNSLRAYAVLPESVIPSPNVAVGYIAYTGDLVKRQQYRNALDVLNEAMVRFAGNEGVISNYRAALNAQIGELVKDEKFEQAMGILETGEKEASRKFPKVEENLYTLILLKLINEKKEPEKAFDYAKTALAKQPGSQNIKNLLINGLKLLQEKLSAAPQKYPDGEAFFLKWYGLIKDADFNIFLERYYVSIADYRFGQKDYDGGMAVIDKGLGFVPGSEFLKTKGGEIAGKAAEEYSKVKSFPEAVKYNLAGRKYFPQDEGFAQNLKILYREWAYSYIENNDFKEAMKIVEEGLKLFPDESKLLYYKDFIRKQK